MFYDTHQSFYVRCDDRECAVKIKYVLHEWKTYETDWRLMCFEIPMLQLSI